jgi:hypothetical protein
MMAAANVAPDLRGAGVVVADTGAAADTTKIADRASWGRGGHLGADRRNHLLTRAALLGREGMGGRSGGL